MGMNISSAPNSFAGLKTRTTSFECCEHLQVRLWLGLDSIFVVMTDINIFKRCRIDSIRFMDGRLNHFYYALSPAGYYFVASLVKSHMGMKMASAKKPTTAASPTIKIGPMASDRALTAYSTSSS